MRISAAARAPRPPGEKATETEQLAPVASVAPHVLVGLKSFPLAPENAMLTICRAADPVLEIVIARAGLVVPTGCLPNPRASELKAIWGAPPVPVIARDCGEFGRLSTTINEAVRVPAAEGEKDTEIEQVAFAASTYWQVPVFLNSPAFGPSMRMLEILSGAAPVFESVIDCALLDVPMA